MPKRNKLREKHHEIILLLLMFIIPSRTFPQDFSNGGKMTVRLVAVRADTEAGFARAAWDGVLKNHKNYLAQHNIDYGIIYAEQTDYDAALETIIDEQPALVITLDYRFYELIQEFAPQNSNIKYAVIDGETIDAPNVMAIRFVDYEGAYLVGVLAALKAKESNIAEPKFGFIGGLNNEWVNPYEIGYVQGILSVLPGARFYDHYLNSWADQTLARSIAKQWYDEGVFAIYTVAGPSCYGVFAQAKEYRSQGRNIWAIGNDVDHYKDGVYSGNRSAILTSMVKNVEAAVLYCLNAVMNNTFSGSTAAIGIAHNGVDYTKTNPAVTERMADYLERIKYKIANGNIQVFENYRDAKIDPKFPRYLKCTN